MTNTLTVVPSKPDAEIAEELKKKALELHIPILALLDEANEKGFQIMAQCGIGPLGKHVITQFQIVKVYK